MKKQRIALPTTRVKNLARAKKMTQDYINGLTYKEISEKYDFPRYMVALWVNDFVTTNKLKSVEETHIHNRLTSLHSRTLNKIAKLRRVSPEDYAVLSQYNRVAAKVGQARLSKTPMTVKIG